MTAAAKCNGRCTLSDYRRTEKVLPEGGLVRAVVEPQAFFADVTIAGHA